MPRPQIDLGRKVSDILQHVDPLPAEAERPIEHYKRSADDLWSLRRYVERKIVGSDYYQNVAKRHMTSLDRMLLVNLIETFERFLKETAAVCVDHLASHVLDDRFNEFPVSGSTLAAHFGAGSVGKALCESAVWLNCKSINDRFRKLLADPFDEQKGTFYLFPQQEGQGPKGEQNRYPIMNLLWQLRHSIVHNVGVITESDAVKFRLLARHPVDSPRILTPQRDDVRYVKQFLDETAEKANERVGERLAELLTALHKEDPTLFNSQEKADELAKQFVVPLSIAANTGTV